MPGKSPRKSARKPARKATRKPPEPAGLELLLTVGGELTSVIVSDDVATSLVLAYTDRVLGHHLAERIVHLKGIVPGDDAHVVQTTLVFPLGSLSKVQLRDLVRHTHVLRTALKGHSGLSVFSNVEEIGFHRIAPQGKEVTT